MSNMDTTEHPPQTNITTFSTHVLDTPKYVQFFYYIFSLIHVNTLGHVRHIIGGHVNDILEG